MRHHARAGPQRPSLLRDLASTSFAQLLTVAMSALSLAVIVRRLGAEDLGLYTLERRAMAVLQPLALVGLTVAVPRYIAAEARSSAGERNAYASGGMALVTLLSAAVAAAILIAPGLVAGIAFGDRSAVDLARALAGFVFAMAIYQAVYSVFRGHMMVSWANALELVAVGGLPLVLALFGPRDIATLIWLLSAGILATTAVLTLVGLRARLRANLRHVRRRVPALLRFGLARTPGDFAVIALFSIGPVIVVHAAGAVEAGYASIVLSTLNLVSVAAVPLGNLLLPRAAADHAAGLSSSSANYVLLWSATLHAALGVCGLLVVASPLVLSVWIPDPTDELVLAQQIAAIGVPGYIVYIVFRSFLDATEHRPYSSIAAVSALLVLLAVMVTAVLAGMDPLIAMAASTALGLSAAGAMIWRFARSRLSLTVIDPATLALCAWLAACFAAGSATDDALGASAVATALAATGYAAIILFIRPPWSVAVRSRFPSARSAPS